MERYDKRIQFVSIHVRILIFLMLDAVYGKTIRFSCILGRGFY